MSSARHTRLPARPAAGLALLFMLVVAAGPGTPLPAGPVAAPAQPPVADPQWRHDWVRGAVFYEIFVRSFADSDGDGVGDLRGLTAKLDYLNDGDPATRTDLGIDAIWLMPIFESPSYHGYDTVDYEKIDREYGTLADFEKLLAEAHRRGIRVILDLVMNHTSSEHPWFEESARSPSSGRRHWYLWRADDPGWTQPWGGTNRTWHSRGGAYYYGVFWGGMPDLNFANPEVRAEILRLADLWLDRGVDGFRLDATRHLFASGPGEEQNDRPETHAFLRELSAAVRASHPEALLVGENWTDTAAIATYFGSTAKVAGGDELPMSFDFPLAAAIVESARVGDAAKIGAVLRENARVFPPGATAAPFLTNHDMIRLATQVGAEAGKRRVAAAVLLTLPGAPFLYYGEEVGLENAAGREDPAKRTPMPWDASPGGGFTGGRPWIDFAPGRERANVAAQRADSTSLLSHYRSLVRLRRGSRPLREGNLELLAAGGAAPGELAWMRTAGSERLLVVHNLSESAILAGPFPRDARFLEPVWTDGGGMIGAAPEGWTVALPPYGSGVWRVR